MPTSKYLRWLKEDQLTTKVAQRFASFCEEDIEQRAKSEEFDAEIYEAAVRLVLGKLENQDKEEDEEEDDEKNENKQEQKQDHKALNHRYNSSSHVTHMRKRG